MNVTPEAMGAMNGMPTRLLSPPRWLEKHEREICVLCGRPMRLMVYDRPEGGVCVRCIEGRDAREIARERRGAVAKKPKAVAAAAAAAPAKERAIVALYGNDAVRIRTLAEKAKCSLAELVRGFLNSAKAD
jgi:hypothetical protein